MSVLKLIIKPLTGVDLIKVEVPKSATGLDLRNAINQSDKELVPYLQRLITPGRVKVADDSKLSDHGLVDGMILNLVILTPFLIYVQGTDERMYTVTVPSSEPELYTISALCDLIGRTIRKSMDEYQIHHLGHPVYGREMILKDCDIKSGSTLVLTKAGIVLDISSNPNVDVCFLVDCTGSMGKHIEAVKNNIKQLRNSLIAEYKNFDLCFSFVRYTDYDLTPEKRTSLLNFTRDINEFRIFVSGIKAGGGGDTPEDIMGGFKIAFNKLNWRPDASKILIHIADAPCHGTTYHDIRGDTYPAGDPAGISHESMMKEIIKLDIQYWFGYINKKLTDKMIGIFNESLRSLSDQRLIIRQFDAIESKEVGQAVQRSVKAGVYGEAARKKGAVHSFKIDTKLPDWNSPSIIEQIAVKTPPPSVLRLPKLLEKLKNDCHLDLEPPSFDFRFKIAPNPFAVGSEHLVYHASDLINFRRIVLKKFKQSGEEHNTLKCYMNELIIHTIAYTHAQEFNMDKLKPADTCPVTFTHLDIVQCRGPLYILELYLDGKIEKFNNNNGYVLKRSPYSDLLQAFSHYTWVKSGKTLLVCDLQGVKDDIKKRVVLSDPAIHSNGKAGEYGSMDGGIDGVNAFFKTHICSDICAKMELVV